MTRDIQAFLLLVGTIVGVGMFAIPSVFQGAGFLTGLAVLAVLAAAAVIVNRAYAEVVLATPTIHRLPGYVARYLGRPAGVISTTSYLFGLSGALLAYVVVGGGFLGGLLRWFLPALPAVTGPALFYLFGVAVISRNIRFESFTNAILTLGLLAAIAVFAFTLAPALDLAGLEAFHPSRAFLPYGVVLFSLSGTAVIPDVRRVLGDAVPRRFGAIMIIGTLVPALLYALFAFAVVGATGEATTPDALSGIAERFGPRYLLAGGVIGFLATITSFITLGLVLEGMLVSDLGARPGAAWLATASIPALLYLAGIQDFIRIVSAVGAIALGLDSVLVLLVHRALAALRIRAGAGSGLALPAAIRGALVVLFAVGIIQELVSIVRG